MVTQKKIILHIEDDARVAAAVACVLRDAGYHVVTAYSAEEGLRKVAKVRPDMLILDIGMPGMSGLTVLNQLRGTGEKTSLPILIFTALPGVVDDAARVAVDGLLVKPADGDSIIAEVDRILAARAANPIA
jgi:two-component system OmpR family response regulator